MATTISQAGVEMIAGGVTSPKGFRAAGVHCGVKAAKRDLALVAADRLSSAAGLFTTNAVKAAPVLVSQEKIQSGVAQAIVINSGNANAATGQAGWTDRLIKSSNNRRTPSRSSGRGGRRAPSSAAGAGRRTGGP